MCGVGFFFELGCFCFVFFVVVNVLFMLCVIGFGVFGVLCIDVDGLFELEMLFWGCLLGLVYVGRGGMSNGG